jgi:hypothetical protein
VYLGKQAVKVNELLLLHEHPSLATEGLYYYLESR